jgi:hypothetical protein
LRESPSAAAFAFSAAVCLSGSLITVIRNHHVHRTSANLTQSGDFVTAVRDSLRGLSGCWSPGIALSRLRERWPKLSFELILSYLDRV